MVCIHVQFLIKQCDHTKLVVLLWQSVTCTNGSDELNNITCLIEIQYHIWCNSHRRQKWLIHFVIRIWIIRSSKYWWNLNVSFYYQLPQDCPQWEWVHMCWFNAIEWSYVIRIMVHICTYENILLRSFWNFISEILLYLIYVDCHYNLSLNVRENYGQKMSVDICVGISTNYT